VESIMPLWILPLALGMFVAVAMFILAPINGLVRTIKAPTRFQLTDLVSLMLLLQLVLAGAAALIRLESNRSIELGEVMPALLVATVGIVVLWGGGVSYISQAQINSPWRRIVFVALILPGTLLLMLGSVAAVVSLIVSFHFDFDRPEFDRHYRFWISFAALNVIVVACCLMRWLVYWVVAKPGDAPSGQG
jgi:hypothetical protein